MSHFKVSATALMWGLLHLWLAGCAASDTTAQEGPPFPRIANLYAVWLESEELSVSREVASPAQVARYDLLVGVKGPWRDPQSWPVLRRRLDELRGINPHLIALDFTYSAPYANPEVPEWGAFYTLPPADAWLRQTTGERIAGWPGTFMLNLSRPEVIEWIAQGAASALPGGGYDGVFIDCMAANGFDWDTCELATGKAFTVDADGDGEQDPRDRLNTQWDAARLALSRRVRELMGERAIFMTNKAPELAYGLVNGILLEDYVDGVLDGDRDWEDVLHTYLHWTGTLHQPNVTTLGCSSGIMTPYRSSRLPEEERRPLLERGRSQLRRMRFGLTTTLMGDGYYSFDMNTRWRGQMWWYPEYDVPLGYPRGTAKPHPDGTWRRQFDGGLVVVNPTPWDARIELPQRHQDVSSHQVDTAFTIPEMDGRILVPTDQPICPGDWPEPEPVLSRSGPAGVVERAGSVVLRWGSGSAARFDAQGNLVGLWGAGEELGCSIRPVIVADQRWEDFATEAMSHHIEPEGRAVFRGRRIHNAQVLEYTETVHTEGAALVLEYDWRAVTPLRLHAFRQAIRLAVSTFGGGRASAAGREVILPAARTDARVLLGDADAVDLVTAEGTLLRIVLPQGGRLSDDRHYAASGYLFAFYPVEGEIPTGQEWTYRVRLIPGGG